jgi:hypothetical protein
MMKHTLVTIIVIALFVMLSGTVSAVSITPDNFIASGGGTVSIETDVVRFDGNLGIRLDHDFSQGGSARVMPYRVNDTTEALWTGADLANWSYWTSFEPNYLPAITFYFDDGVSDYYSGSNVTHTVNLTSIGNQLAEGNYNGVDWWNVTSEDAYTYYVNSPSAWGPSSNKRWADIVSANGVRAGFGASAPTYYFHDAAIVGILIGYPGQLGSKVTETAYLDGININGEDYSVVPEPASMVMLGMLGAGMAATRLRKRNKKS